MNFKVGDRISISNDGGLCPNYESWASEHRLYKFIEGYDPNPRSTGDLKTPIEGTIIVIDDFCIGIDTGKYHLIYDCASHHEYITVIGHTSDITLPENLFTL